MKWLTAREMIDITHQAYNEEKVKKHVDYYISKANRAAKRGKRCISTISIFDLIILPFLNEQENIKFRQTMRELGYEFNLEYIQW